MSMIVLDAVARTFRQPGGDVKALDDISLEIGESEFVVVTGASGSGKSTLLAILGLMDAPTSGAMRLGGDDVTSLTPAALASRRLREFGFVFQDFLLVRHLSAIDNVSLPALFAGVAPRRATAHALELLDSVGLADRADHRPGELSRGEMARVAIARALVNRPRILLADEPTANLDRDGSERVWELLHARHANDGVAVIVATHNRERVAAASRVVALRDGRLVR